MNYSKVAIIVLGIIHVVSCGIAIYDLVFYSRRAKKIQWGIFLLVVPFLGVFVYSVTKRRPGRPASPTKLNN